MSVHDIDPEFPAKVWPKHWREVKERGSFTFESRHRAKDGRIFPVEITVNYLEFSGKEYNCAFARNITDRKQAEDQLRALNESLEGRVTERTAALRDSEARVRTLLDAIPDAMFRVGKDGTYLEFVPAKGFNPLVPPSEFLGRKVHEVLPTEVAEESLRHVRRALKTGNTQVFEYQLQEGRGEIRHYEARLVVSGKKEVLALVRDITERKRAEEAAQRAREDLESRVERRLERGNAYGLSFRELTVLHLVAAGKADKEIATDLGISPLTASKHLVNILRKMKASSRTEAGVRALREKLVE